ncbi:hypothetical protein [Legionella sp.]|uniref:hypothetical protein n=1 Tax=Legionella sp. TaxID=459 RepID=UPI003C8DCD30
MKILSGLLFSSFIGISSITFAAGGTSLSSDWVCTTNASSSDFDADKAADKQMSENAKSIAEAFSFAAQNCRDCTKITCTIK